LLFQSPEIDTKQVDGVTAPTNDLEVGIHMSDGLTTLRGSVAVPGVSGPQPVSGFRIRIIKTRELHGSTHDPNNNWERVYNSKGEFTAELPGPGIYVLEVTAEGFATVRSEPISTDHLPKDPLRLMLTKGASLVGTVVDEEGRPIDGALVLSLAKAGGQLPLSLERNVDEEIGVRTVAGHFQFDGLSPGTDTFQALHADYAVTTARNVEIPAQAPGKLTIVMKRGGTVCGHVHDERGRPAAGVHLQFRRYAGHFFGERDSRFAAAVTDENGCYEVRHLPEELVHIVRDSRGADSLGVWHRTVLPASGKTRTVDFGAGATISGRLLINGAPRASTRLLLSDESPTGDDFAANTMTGKEGAFVFTGVPRGRRYLYFSAMHRKRGPDDWVHVRAIDVNTAAHDLGKIDHRVGRVSVKVVGRNDDSASADLFYTDSSMFQVHRWAGELMRPRAKNAPHVFDDVAMGQYDVYLAAQNGGGATIKHRLAVTCEKPNPTVTIEWPKGTGSIRGSIDAPLRELMGHGWLFLASPNERWLGYVRVDESGRFELKGIPAGDYSLVMRRWSGGVLPVTLKEFRLADGETKTLDFTQAAVPQSELAKESVRVSVFTPDGMQLPGYELRLVGPPGQPPLPKPTLSQGSSKQFALPRGSYTFVASYLGAVSAPQTVEVKPVLKDGNWITRDHAVNLTVAPSE
jgi:hypothetical protein